MEICNSLADLTAFRAALALGGQPLALIPTMGALHVGHLSLIAAAQRDGYATLASIFLNPTQFAADEDLATYPSTYAADVAQLKTQGCTALFAPPPTLMYPPGEQTRVRVPMIAARWEGQDRPQFFEGVATVVTKLLIAAQAEAAYFGEKDYQQLQVIKRLTADLLIPTQIIACPTVRAPSGLALSSRNAYLSPEEQESAAEIYAALTNTAALILEDPRLPLDILLDSTKQRIRRAGFAEVSYLAYVDAQTLEPAWTRLVEGQGRLLFAGTLGTTRLIDNLAV